MGFRVRSNVISVTAGLVLACWFSGSAAAQEVPSDAGPGFAAGLACGGALQGIARQPEAQGAIRDSLGTVLEAIIEDNGGRKFKDSFAGLAHIGRDLPDAISRQPEVADALLSLADECVSIIVNGTGQVSP